MATLFTLLAGKVSQKYHRRIEEILRVMDLSIDYKVKTTKNLSGFKHSLDLCLGDQTGYQNLNSTVTVYNGHVTTYPRNKVDGEFVFVVVKTKLLNPVSQSSKTENHILIYEQGISVKQTYKGVI